MNGTRAIIEYSAQETGALPAGATHAHDAIELRSALFEVMQRPKLSPAERYREIAAAVVAALHKRGRFFFHSEFQDHATAMYFDAHRKLLLRIASDAFCSWLADFVGVNRADRTFAFIKSAIEDETLTGMTTGLLPEMFWASRAGAIYLSNGDGFVAKITAAGVCLVDNGTDDVLFEAGQTLRPWHLVDPRDPFEACRVFSAMRATAGHGRDLLRLWATALPSNQRCKPPLVLSGAIGSGKTRTALGIAELYGLPSRVIVPTEKGEDDLWTSLDGGGFLILDNADTRLKWLPDALAAAATDGSHEKRRLYSDSARCQQKARAWVCITSANPTFGADAGLADRLLVERLERREGDTADSALADEIAEHRDAGLSWIAEVLAAALADAAPVSSNLNKRHPDFAALAVRIGRAIGREREAIAALTAAENDKGLFNLENDDLGAALLDYMSRTASFSGTAQDLQDALFENDPESGERWNARRLGKRLWKLWPHIEGVFKATANRGHGGILTYKICHRGGFGGFEEAISPKVA